MIVFSIVGPTATGKTTFAFHLAQTLLQLNEVRLIDFISVDSRQVYQGMEVVTGVDLPAEFQRKAESANLAFPYFQSGSIRFHGVAMIPPTHEWSVTHFRDFALPVIEKSFAEHGQPILVGGTGLYHDHLFTFAESFATPPNDELRKKAATLPLAELQNWVQKEQPAGWVELNQSDRANPRRLIRVLERGSAQSSPSPASEHNYHLVKIGLKNSLENLGTKIKTRIDQRLAHGALTEVQNLVAHYDEATWQLPAFSATGLKELRAYLTGQLELDQLKALWLKRELQYAKRQLTWWKKDPTVTWFDVSEADWLDQATQFATSHRRQEKSHVYSMT